MSGYSDSREHLLAELDRIDALVRTCLSRAQRAVAVAAPEAGASRAATIDQVLSGPGGLPAWSLAPGWPSDEWSRAWERINEELAQRREASLREGTELRFVDLCRRFGLTPFDADVVLVCAASEIDLRYEEVFAFFHGNATRGCVTVDLALNLLCSSLGQKLDAASRFFADAPLVRHRIVRFVDDGVSGQGAPWLARTFKLDDRIVRHLLGSDEIDAPLTSLLRRAPDVRETPSTAPHVASVEGALVRRAADRSLLVHLEQPRNGDGLDVASAACARANMDLLVLDVDRVAALPEPHEPMLSLVLREAILRGAALFLADAGSAKPKYLDALVELQARMPPAVIFVSRDAPWEPEPSPHVEMLSLPVPLPNGTERAALWREALRERSPELEAEVDAVAAKFRFSAAQVRGAAAGADRRARHGANGGVPTVDELYDACRARSGHTIDELARRIRPHYRWEDIVLPDDALQQMREVCQRVTHRARVLDQWGFAGKLSLGRGLNVLFAGPSGTGKTMAAEIMGRELRLDLFRIDLSSVVSKYIGETEKNLSTIFAAAETSNAILFFDEADALFGKRSEVKDAHDRYANVETSYLLQRMEEYEGITILATNMRRNLDDAFARRMAFTITFPVPEEEERLRIWRQVWPVSTPRDEALDLPFMARQFKFSGGNIKNIAVAAAFLAAADGGVVEMRHVVRAAKRELQKLGKSSFPSEFGPYAHHDVPGPL